MRTVRLEEARQKLRGLGLSVPHDAGNREMLALIFDSDRHQILRSRLSTLLLTSGDFGDLAVSAGVRRALERHFIVVEGDIYKMDDRTAMRRWGDENVKKTDYFWSKFLPWLNAGRPFLKTRDARFPTWLSQIDPITEEKYTAALAEFEAEISRAFPELARGAKSLKEFNVDRFEEWQWANMERLRQLPPRAVAAWDNLLTAFGHRHGYVNLDLFQRLHVGQNAQQLLLIRTNDRQVVLGDFARDPQEYEELRRKVNPFLIDEQAFVKIFVTGAGRKPHQGSLRQSFTLEAIDKEQTPSKGILSRLLDRGVARAMALRMAVGIHIAETSEELNKDIALMAERDCETFLWAALAMWSGASHPPAAAGRGRRAVAGSA